MSGQRNPEIQRLLASLRDGGLPAEASQDRQYESASSLDVRSQLDNLPGLGMLGTGEEKSSSHTSSQRATPQSAPNSASLERPQDRPTTPSIPDASTIITWSAALRHVSRYLVPNEKAAAKIKHLISEQHKHERQWWAGREAVVARNSGRAGNQAKVADLLKSLGGASIPVAQQDPKADQAELDAYDEKVYKSLMSMATDFDKQLKGLQVPFFAIKHELVISEDGDQKGGTIQGRLDKGELRELQKRMMETLQDLFGDD